MQKNLLGQNLLSLLDDRQNPRFSLRSPISSNPKTHLFKNMFSSTLQPSGPVSPSWGWGPRQSLVQAGTLRWEARIAHLRTLTPFSQLFHSENNLFGVFFVFHALHLLSLVICVCKSEDIRTLNSCCHDCVFDGLKFS